MSATQSKTNIDRLRERVPDSCIRQRKQGGNTLSYISWYDACNLLDERAPGWSVEIKQVGEMTGKVFVRVALTIDGITRENIGCEDEELKGYGDVFSNAFGMALRRAAALFGLGRHLYDKDDKRPAPSRPVAAATKPESGSGSQPQGVKLALPNQIDWISGKIKDIAQASQERWNCPIESLTFAQATAWIAEIREGL